MENLSKVQLNFDFEVETVAPKKKPKSHKKQQDDFVFSFMDCLTSPIIVYKSAWQDLIPKDLLNNVRLSRLLCSMQQEEMASLTETLAYMMPRTYEAPMPVEWANIYTWLGLQYAMKFKKDSQLKAMQDIAPKELTPYEKGKLDDLRRWIYEQRRKALKASLKKIKAPKVETKMEHSTLF